MKKTWLLLVTLALLLTGCAQQSRHPEWDEEWTRFGDLMAVEAPEGFAPGEYNDVLSLNGIWYATWISGEARSVQTAEGEEATAYDAQLYLLIRECGSEDEANANLHDWFEREAQSYEAGDPYELSAAGQYFSCLPLLSASAENPYSHGAAAFAVRGNLAFSVEVLCVEGFDGDAQELLEQFLNGIHYGE